MKERNRVENLDRWEHIIKMDLKNRIGGADWVNLAQDRDKRRATLGAVIHFWILQNAGNLFTS